MLIYIIWLLALFLFHIHSTFVVNKCYMTTSIAVPTDKGPSLSGDSHVSLNVRRGDVELDCCRCGKAGVVSHEMSASAAEYSLVRLCDKEVNNAD